VDTLVLSVGLLPEAELLRQIGLRILPYTGSAAVDQFFQTDIPGVFVVGNGVGIWDLVDNVAISASIAGARAAKSQGDRSELAEISPTDTVRVVIPQRLSLGELEPPRLWFRVACPMPVGVALLTRGEDEVIARKGFAGLKPAEMAEFPLKEEQYRAIKPGDKLQLKVAQP